MMNSSQTSEMNSNFSVATYGGLEAWSSFSLAHPKFGTVPGKQFLRKDLGLTSMEVSLNSIAPGGSVPFLHGHRQNEELYLFLAGRGQMLLDGEVIEVAAGTSVRVAPPALRSWRNTGSVPLTCIVIQAKAGSLSQASAADGFIAPGSPAWPDAT